MSAVTRAPAQPSGIDAELLQLIALYDERLSRLHATTEELTARRAELRQALASVQANGHLRGCRAFDNSGCTCRALAFEGAG